MLEERKGEKEKKEYEQTAKVYGGIYENFFYMHNGNVYLQHLHRTSCACIEFSYGFSLQNRERYANLEMLVLKNLQHDHNEPFMRLLGGKNKQANILLSRFNVYVAINRIFADEIYCP